MAINLEIADVIDRNQLHQTYDEYCKKILSNKQVLAYILKTCAAEFETVSLTEIPKYIEQRSSINRLTAPIEGMSREDHSVSGAEIIYDILAQVRIPDSDQRKNISLIINLEAQSNDQVPYPLLSRGIYYGSRLLARQKNREVGFEHSDFQDLMKVYSIWVVMNTSKKKEGVLNRYTLKEECFGKEYHFPQKDYDKLAIVMIYPKQEYDVNDDEHSLMELLHILFQSTMPSVEKKRQLQENYGIQMTRELETEVESVCNLSQVFVDQGRAEGLKKGKAEERIHNTILNLKHLMKNANIDVDKAMNMLGIADDLRPIVKEQLS